MSLDQLYIIKKYEEDDLKDRSRAPKIVHNKTPGPIEDLVVEVKNQTNYGPEKLSDYLSDYHQTTVPAGTRRTYNTFCAIG
jgi:hypothetical protein